MKLFIDDIRNAPDETWHVARTVTEAIRAIYYYGHEISEISLDHDISHQVSVGSLSRPYPCEETYAAVCYFMIEYYKGRTAPAGFKVIIHSANIRGVENMQLLLSKAGIQAQIEMRKAANRLELEIHE